TPELCWKGGSYADGVIVGSALVHQLLDNTGRHVMPEEQGLADLAQTTHDLAEAIHGARG
ncbi:MAG: tryptophan synthase subunit alpha, partial [Bifidobacterium aquikefiri]